MKKFEDLLHELQVEDASSKAMINVYKELVHKLCNTRIEAAKICIKKGQASTFEQNLDDNLLTHHTNLHTKIKYNAQCDYRHYIIIHLSLH